MTTPQINSGISTWESTEIEAVGLIFMLLSSITQDVREDRVPLTDEDIVVAFATISRRYGLTGEYLEEIFQRIVRHILQATSRKR